MCIYVSLPIHPTLSFPLLYPCWFSTPVPISVEFLNVLIHSFNPPKF